MGGVATKIYSLKAMEPKDIKALALGLKNGKTAVMATDTVYGIMLAANTRDNLEKLNKIKNNPPNKYAQLLCDLNQAFTLASVDDNFRKAASLWPGGLTIVARSSEEGGKISGVNTIGLRVPASSLILDIIGIIGAPLYASSANLHNRAVCETEAAVLALFNGLVDFIVLDGNRASIPSTVIDLAGEELIVRRAGALEDKIKKLLS
ncbi:MAG: L-threonylcarbamoyladenylate synthase [Elusimicrobiota bacterium]|jgi:L-threonylcarbamoyladenylate synthase|nr:L-threonylcarbamoyladenylate synthase [Elusimicrobiota bacterium]